MYQLRRTTIERRECVSACVKYGCHSSGRFLPSIVNFPVVHLDSLSLSLSLLFSLSVFSRVLLFLSSCPLFPIRLSASSSRFLPPVPLSLSLDGAGSFLGTAPLLPSGVTAPTDSGWSLAGTLVHSGGQRSDSGRYAAETPESRPVSWLPGGSRLHRSCAGAAILHSFGSMTVVHELSRVSWLRATSSPVASCYHPPSLWRPCLHRRPIRVVSSLSPCTLHVPRPPHTRARARTRALVYPPLYNSRLYTLTLRARPEASRAPLQRPPLSRACNILANERAKSHRVASEHQGLLTDDDGAMAAAATVAR